MAAKQMIKQGMTSFVAEEHFSQIEIGSGGKIIGAASMVAHKGVPMMAGYSSSKWGVRGLTVSLKFRDAQL